MWCKQETQHIPQISMIVPVSKRASSTSLDPTWLSPAATFYELLQNVKFFTSEAELCAQLWYSPDLEFDTVTKEGLSPTGIVWEVLHQHEACCFTRRCLHITLKGAHMFMEQRSNRNKYLIKWYKNKPVLGFYFFPLSWNHVTGLQ